MREPCTITIADNPGFQPGDTLRMSDGRILEITKVEHHSLTLRGLSLLYKLVSWMFFR